MGVRAAVQRYCRRCRPLRFSYSLECTQLARPKALDQREGFEGGFTLECVYPAQNGNGCVIGTKSAIITLYF